MHDPSGQIAKLSKLFSVLPVKIEKEYVNSSVKKLDFILLAVK